jgi:signal transduction histidine kinase
MKKDSEDAPLLASDPGLHALCHTLRDPVAVIALPSGAILEANAPFAQTFGLALGQPVDRSLADLSPRLARAIRGWNGDGPRDFARIVVGGVSGRVRLIPIPGTSHAFLHFLPKEGGVDPARLQQLIEERLEQLKNFERLRSLGEVAAIIVHELRTPLTTVKMTVDSVRREASLDPHARRKLETAWEQIERLDRLLSGIREFTRPQPLQCRAIAARDLFAMLRRAVEPAVARPGLELVQEVADPSLAIFGDPERLVEALQNLIVNAAEAIPGSGTISVSAATSRRRRGWSEIRVADTGPGIPPEAMRRMFQPFFTTKRHGTGLGLSIVKKICDLHGGFVSVKSSGGRGTTVTLELPPAPKA